jgi:predicted secreted hydrolase
MMAALRVLVTALLVLEAGVAAAAVLPETQAGSGFAQADAPRRFEFPADHGPHPAFRQEWWYVTGNLEAASGERFGFELTFFRFALTPPGAQAPDPASSRWRAREIYMAHFAITDVARARFRYAEKLSRGALGLAGAQGAPLAVWIDDWSLTAAAGQPWRISAALPGYDLELTLEPQQAPVLNGAGGLSRKAAEASAASYYYSVPRLAVRGHLVRDGANLDVRGLAWLDREWGSGGLGAREVGWDWFALQLDDGSALMFYALRDAGGTRDPYSAGTFIAADGSTQALASADVSLATQGEWRNPDGVRYPAAWRITVPRLSLDVRVRPLLADQELLTHPPYWEGAVEVSGTRSGNALGGRGYVELTGYAQERMPGIASGAAPGVVR